MLTQLETAGFWQAVVLFLNSLGTLITGLLSILQSGSATS